MVRKIFLSNDEIEIQFLFTERKEILEQHMKGVTLSESPEVFSERLATLTPGFSGADLANLINEAALHAARVKNPAVNREDLEYAIGKKNLFEFSRLKSNI